MFNFTWDYSLLKRIYVFFCDTKNMLYVFLIFLFLVISYSTLLHPSIVENLHYEPAPWTAVIINLINYVPLLHYFIIYSLEFLNSKFFDWVLTGDVDIEVLKDLLVNWNLAKEAISTNSDELQRLADIMSLSLKELKEIIESRK